MSVQPDHATHHCIGNCHHNDGDNNYPHDQLVPTSRLTPKASYLHPSQLLSNCLTVEDDRQESEIAEDRQTDRYHVRNSTRMPPCQI